MTKKSSFRFVALFCTILLSAQASWSQAPHGFTPDFPDIRKDLEAFQEIIAKTLLENLQGPVPILSTPKGTYLPDYGAVFNVEGNLYEIRAISPFSPNPRTQKELDDAYSAMLQRVEDLRERMLKTIGQYGSKLEHLKPEESIAVVVHLFNGYDDPKRPCPAQLIFRVKKAAISDYQQKTIGFEEFAKKIEINRL